MFDTSPVFSCCFINKRKASSLSVGTKNSKMPSALSNVRSNARCSLNRRVATKNQVSLLVIFA
ncbi:MAG: hypothetical protein UW09_C0001G0142 [candidate division TM6 bacterium GW2011_GWF2_43_87]|nr:MAG: hypothetical protein UW09_C0001G0142 [candidate division TM6 bacterium GW2011_GWF2_43_87]